jgi:hypothetical protein
MEIVIDNDNHRHLFEIKSESIPDGLNYGSDDCCSGPMAAPRF